MAKNKTSRAWIHEHLTDAYVQRARREGYRSRAAYKLSEILRQDRLFAPGMAAVDLGAAPGGWCQVLAEVAGPHGRVYALDLLEIVPVAGVRFIRGDFREEQALAQLEAALEGERVDLVVSDMAPNMSGVALVDQARTAHLAELALEFAVKWLKPAGALLVKTFQGASQSEFRQTMTRQFQQVAVRKPEASRSRSSEVYLLGRGLKAPAAPLDSL